MRIKRKKSNVKEKSSHREKKKKGNKIRNYKESLRKVRLLKRRDVSVYVLKRERAGKSFSADRLRREETESRWRRTEINTTYIRTSTA